MNDDVIKIFGAIPAIDPAVALPKIPVTLTPKYGPLHKVQFVIEYVGPRSVLASQAAKLLDPQWYRALGSPTMYAMRPADLHWAPLTSALDGSYDSIALTWDFLGEEGQLSSASCLQLLQTAERIGPYLQRRPMPIPEPADVDTIVEALLAAREVLDLGFAINVVSERDFAERDIWIQCARLGLDFDSSGAFAWRLPDTLGPLLYVTPFGASESFSLGAVQRGVEHAGVTIGFSVPRCPSPRHALDGAFHIAKVVAGALGGAIFTDDERPMTTAERKHLFNSMDQALVLFGQAGLVPGSAECAKLFPDA